MASDLMFVLVAPGDNHPNEFNFWTFRVRDLNFRQNRPRANGSNYLLISLVQWWIFFLHIPSRCLPESETLGESL
jgi:hypothetical protein